MQAVRWVRPPYSGVGEHGAAIEEVAQEGGCEESGGEAGCAAAEGVFVDLGEAGAEVKESGYPGEHAAGEFDVVVSRGLGGCGSGWWRWCGWNDGCFAEDKADERYQEECSRGDTERRGWLVEGGCTRWRMLLPLLIKRGQEHCRSP